MSWDYTDKTVQLFMDAVQGKPGTHIGEIKDPDGLGEYGSITCGDAIRFTFRVDKHPSDPLQDKIVEVKYLTFGCTSAISSSEALCALIEQQELTPIQALKITNKDIINYQGGLPSEKIHCSVMGAEALEAAVFNWSKNRNVDLEGLGIHIHPVSGDESPIVCHCFTISDEFLRRKIKELSLHSIDDITRATKAGGACKHCHYTPGGLQDILESVWGSNSVPAQSSHGEAGKGLLAQPSEAESFYQFSKKIESVIDTYIRPSLKADNGDISIIDIKDKKVYCTLLGSCSTCAGAKFTMRNLIEHELKERLDPEIKVITVKED